MTSGTPLAWDAAVLYMCERELQTFNSKVNASCKAVQMFAYSDRWSCAAERWCSGLRPAPNFHTWWGLNKGRDFITPLTPNNTGYRPHNPHKPPQTPSAPLTICQEGRHEVHLSDFLKLNQCCSKSLTSGIAISIDLQNYDAWLCWILDSDI